MSALNKQQIKQKISEQALAIGFSSCGFSTLDLNEHAEYYRQWLDKKYYGDMEYMKTRESIRLNPKELVESAFTIISVTLNYLPSDAQFGQALASNKANISRYALGRDYHKLMRKKLARLTELIKSYTTTEQHRPFVDSAPILERAYAEQSNLGWIGKNTMLIHPTQGSFFFIGEIVIDLDLNDNENYEKKIPNQCGECKACLVHCPTDAFASPYVLDARKCISYLTIEHFGSIPIELRKPIGNRIYGCDDCQIVCPWNRFAIPSDETDFKPRNSFEDIELLELFSWNENTFLKQTEGSPIRRIGFERWQRNLAVALGNAHYSKTIVDALLEKLKLTTSPLVLEHLTWALSEQENKKDASAVKNENKLDRTCKKILKRFY